MYDTTTFGGKSFGPETGLDGQIHKSNGFIGLSHASPRESTRSRTLVAAGGVRVPLCLYY